MITWLKSLFGSNRPEKVPQLTPEEELEMELSKRQIHFVKAEAMTLEQATQIALEISGDFEGEGFSQVTGNFDGQLLSCGALQWCWRMETQQKLILKVEQLYPGVILKYMPMTGKKYLQCAGMPVSKTSTLVSCWSDRSRVFNPYYSELKNLWGSPEMISVQVYFANTIAKKAAQYAIDWSKADGRSDYNLQEFCFFFDVVVNNGSMLGLTYHDVIDRVQRNSQAEVIHEILGWCLTRDRTHAAYKDTLKNAELWKSMLGSDLNQINLFILGWLRSLKAIHTYQAAVMNRRGTLAMGVGYCEAEKKDLNNKYIGIWPSSLIS